MTCPYSTLRHESKGLRRFRVRDGSAPLSPNAHIVLIFAHRRLREAFSAAPGRRTAVVRFY
jgi:hypothetical protein